MSGARVGSGRWFRGAAKLAAFGRSGVGLRVSGRDAIFVDEPVTGSGASDLLVEFDHGRVAFIGGCSLAETAMGSVLVVMSHELFEEPTQVGVGPERPAGVSADGFLRPALRTGRATFTASGSPPDPSF
jgi:hypothetical protein